MVTQTENNCKRPFQLSLLIISVRIEKRKLFRSDKDVPILLFSTVRLICHLFFNIQLNTLRLHTSFYFKVQYLQQVSAHNKPSSERQINIHISYKITN
jgi:hypothetical protein